MTMVARDLSSGSHQPYCRDQYEDLDEVQNEAQIVAHGGTNSRSGLTASSQSQVNDQLRNNNESLTTPSRWLMLTRWLTAILLSAAFTFCLVLSKVGIIQLGQDLYLNLSVNATPKPPPPTMDARHTPTSDTNNLPETTLAMIIISLLVPLVIRLVGALWSRGFSADNQWPAYKALAAGILASILDSLGLAVFVIGVIPNTSPSVAVSLMNGVFFAHASFMFFLTLYPSFDSRENVHRPQTSTNCHRVSIYKFQESNKQGKTPCRARILDRFQRSRPYCLVITLAFTMLVSATGGMLIISCYPCEDIFRHRTAVWATPVSLGCLGVAWCGPLQRLQPEQDVSGRRACWTLTVICSLLRLVLLPGGLLTLTNILHPEMDLSRIPASITDITPDLPMFPYFITTVVCSLAAYLLGRLAYAMSMEHFAFDMPVTMATPIVFLLTVYMESCKADIFSVRSHRTNCRMMIGSWPIVIPGVVCLYLGQLLCTVCSTLHGRSMLIWLPGYNGAFLEQYMTLGRKTVRTDNTQADRLVKAISPRVFICITMYRETVHEMEQVLRSLCRIYTAKQYSDKHYQGHIFFDNGVRAARLTQFALQLVDIAVRVFASDGFTLQTCTKVPAPYGMQLRWQLGEKGMDFVIHLKDSLLVKSRKRWSQVMYMSYVLEFYIKEDMEATDSNTFILTVDGDGVFMPSSVEAMLDHIMRDDKVGAVCNCTHPTGSGPVVWYQLFDYAIGHWFEKETNHTLGTVLICPGCFSLYRAAALRQVLPTYSSSVTHASEFLTKDMGEDRWLSTLLIQSGWRLEYSAATGNYSSCPQEFDEFFKQRRRWIPSKLANIVLLLQKWKMLYSSNSHISLILFVYQAILLFYTLVSPAVCMLLVSRGVHYVWGVSHYTTISLLYTITCAYVAVCLITSPDMQLKVSKVLTVLGAIMMFAVTVGAVVQLADGNPSLQQTALQLNYTLQGGAVDVPPMSLTCLYLLVLMFLLAGLLHLPDTSCLLHGVWYLLCLPASHIILITYSIVNLNNRCWGTREEATPPAGSWGTREEATPPAGSWGTREEATPPAGSWGTREEATPPAGSWGTREEATPPAGSWGTREEATPPAGSWGTREEATPPAVSWGTREEATPPAVSWGTPEEATPPAGSWGTREEATPPAGSWGTRKEATPPAGSWGTREEATPPAVSWGMQKDAIRNRNNNGILQHLQRYFNRCSPDDEPLGNTSAQTCLISSKDKDEKRSYLAYCMNDEAERPLGKLRAKLELLPTGFLSDSERTFWSDLRQERLLPTSSPYSDERELKDKLSGLRNVVLVVFGVANTLWIVLMLFLIPKCHFSIRHGISTLGVFSMILYGAQFVGMLIHRVSSFVNLIARVPPRCGNTYHNTRSWMENNGTVSTSNAHAGLNEGIKRVQKQLL